MNIIKISAQLADDILQSVHWLAGRLSNTGSAFSFDQAMGQKAEVSVPIATDGVGEVIMVLGQARQHYPARALDGKTEFARGASVTVSDLGVNLVYVS